MINKQTLHRVSVVLLGFSASLLTPSDGSTAPITVTVTIPSVRLIQGDDVPSFTDDELYSRASIAGGGYQQSGIVGGVDEGDTIRPNWRFSAQIDPRGQVNYNVPISLQLWDDDGVSGDDQIDVNPGSGSTFSLSYNLATGAPSAGATTGNAGARATLAYQIASTPFQYLAQVTTQIALGQVSYALTNLSASTFNVSRFFLPIAFLPADLLPFELQPGQTFNYIYGTYDTNFSVASALVGWEDVNGTSLSYPILIPVAEPGGVALLASGLFGLLLAVRRRSASPAA